MAFPGTPTRTTYVSATSNSTSWAAFSNVSVPAGSLAVFIVASDGNPTLSVGGGDTDWTKLGQASNSTTCTGGVWSWFNSTGSSVDKSFTLSSTNSEQYSGILLLIPRATAGYSMSIEGTPANGSSTNSNPPSLTPTAGSQDYKWIVTRSGDSTVVATVAPTNFSNLQSRAGGGTNGASTNSAERDLNGTVLDPGTFTSASEQWVAYTLAVWEWLAPHDLTATGIETGAPSVGSPAITQAHALATAALETGGPTTGTPALGQAHALGTSELTSGTPATGTPNLAEAHTLTANSLASGDPTTGAPALAQSHALSPSETAAGDPTTGSPSLGQAHALGTESLELGAPNVGAPDLGQAHALAAPALDAASPTVGSPALGQAHALSGAGIETTSPGVETTTLGQTHALATSELTSGTSTNGTPSLAEAHTLTADSLSAGAPTTGAPTLGQDHALSATPTTAGATTLGSPVLSVGDSDDLEADSIETGVPSVGAPALESSPPSSLVTRHYAAILDQPPEPVETPDDPPPRIHTTSNVSVLATLLEPKTPSEEVEYTIGVAAEGASIATVTLAPSGLSILSRSYTSTQIRFTVTGGVPGVHAKVTARITLSSGRIFTRIFVIPIQPEPEEEEDPE